MRHSMDLICSSGMAHTHSVPSGIQRPDRRGIPSSAAAAHWRQRSYRPTSRCSFLPPPASSSLPLVPILQPAPASAPVPSVVRRSALELPLHLSHSCDEKGVSGLRGGQVELQSVTATGWWMQRGVGCYFSESCHMSLPTFQVFS